MKVLATAGQTLALDDIGEATAGHGVETYGVTLKDGGIRHWYS